MAFAASSSEQQYAPAPTRNDEAALDALFTRHYAGLRRHARRMLPYPTDDAEDVMADVFCTLWTQAQATVRGLVAWVAAAAANERTLDQLKTVRQRSCAPRCPTSTSGPRRTIAPILSPLGAATWCGTILSAHYVGHDVLPHPLIRIVSMKTFLLLLPLLAMLTPAVAQQPLDIQGHRGCRGLLPENTVPAMLKALDLGVTTLEMDVAISQDKQVLLSHDPYMNADFVHAPDGQPLTPAAGQALRLYGLPYADIRRYDVGSHGNPKFPRQEKLKTHKPLLAEVIDAAEAHARQQHRPLPQYNIETKTTPAGDNTLHPEPEEFMRLLLAVVTEKGVQDRVIIQSFDPRTLEIVHRTHPTLRTALLVENPDGLARNLQRLSFRPTIYSPYYKLVTPKLVQTCHKQHIQVIPWTVNSAAAIKELMAQKVDGIITDYPDLFSDNESVK